ncbi:uncharacterized protein B0I36DRAFT_64387 [Microdochium trichocladiopsis]|uniref:Uncharacterized protein n=1 Tax=Microdochium trichocladiopsis TaxID=1682393 RepID=A0A9P9BXS1_9PEZI|nr:uncharacterized protein B0I36DRAFT_64387 [Microdochium trichocladiopsis]KAH7037318.1 hypothetical protein B0I36DRAFT_64387 [Microdochium trichocladiopsis]
MIKSGASSSRRKYFYFVNPRPACRVGCAEASLGWFCLGYLTWLTCHDAGARHALNLSILHSSLGSLFFPSLLRGYIVVTPSVLKSTSLRKHRHRTLRSHRRCTRTACPRWRTTTNSKLLLPSEMMTGLLALAGRRQAAPLCQCIVRASRYG